MQLVLYKKGFGCMAFFDQLAQKLSDLGGGGTTLTEDLHDCGRRAIILFEINPGICLATEERHRKSH
jgi:hypothetical protein